MKFMIAHSPDTGLYYILEYTKIVKKDNLNILDEYRILAVKDKVVYPKLPFSKSEGVATIAFTDEGLKDNDFEFIETESYDDAMLLYLTKYNFGGD